MKSHKLIENDHILYVVNTLLELYNYKKWICEIIIESFIYFLNQVTISIAQSLIFPHLKKLLPNKLEDATSSQIVLIIGIQNYFKINKDTEIFDIKDFIPDTLLISYRNFNLISNTLIESCGGYPKVLLFVIMICNSISIIFKL
jgi:hypothetical protein